MVTMRDVADRAGVSITTVSFVINNTKAVQPSTRARVSSAMTELGYRPNLLARALARRETRVVALVYPALDHRLTGSGIDFINAAAQAAVDLDHHLIVWPGSHDPDQILDLGRQGMVDGIVLMEIQMNDRRVEALRGASLPFTMIGRTRRHKGLSYVDIDFARSIATGYAHLDGLGHQHIVFVNGNLENPQYRQYGPYVRSAEAFSRLASRHGREPIVVQCEPTMAAAASIVDQVMAQRPQVTAMLIMNEVVGMGASRRLEQKGRSVPGDVSLVTMSGSDMASYSSPSMTYLQTPGPELGRMGVELLINQLAGAANGTGARSGQLVPCDLMIGDSTGPAPR